MSTAYRREARLIGSYLLDGDEPVEAALDLYEQAMARMPLVLSYQEQKLMERVLYRPVLWPWIDAGLALSNPKSGIRRKVFVMSAILETQPAYASRFLPYQHSGFQHSAALLNAFLAGVRAALGFILVKVIA